MADITINDLDMSQELDKKAMSNILGGWVSFTSSSVLYEAQVSQEILGIFIDLENGTMSQRYRDVYYRVIRGERVYSQALPGATPTPTA